MSLAGRYVLFREARDLAAQAGDMNLVRALLAQLASIPGQTEANAGRVVEILGAHRDVEIAVFPELFLGGYDLSLVRQSARSPDLRRSRTTGASKF